MSLRLSATQSAHSLDEASIQAFRRDGFCSSISVLSGSEAMGLRAQVEMLEARSHGRLSCLVRAKPHLLIPFLWNVVHDPRIVDKIESLLGPDLYCIGSSTIDKPVGSDGYVAWHQDATFWGLSRTEGATAWLALSSSRPESGCMEVVPGSHTQQLDHLDTEDPLNMLGAREAVCQQVDPSATRPLVLESGQMSVHHPLVLHGSARNRTGDRRLGFVIRYVPASVRQAGGTVTLVRGRNLSQMPLEVAPEGELHPAALARHGAIIRRCSAVIRRAKQAHLEAVRLRSEQAA